MNTITFIVVTGHTFVCFHVLEICKESILPKLNATEYQPCSNTVDSNTYILETLTVQ